MSDYSRDVMRAELMIGMGLCNLRAVVKLPTDGLPQPLQASAEQMQDPSLTEDERKAASSEFLTRSEEWIDSAPMDSNRSSEVDS